MKIVKTVGNTLTIFTIITPLIIYYLKTVETLMWSVSLVSLTLLMLIRPLGEIFPKSNIDKLMPLRKELGRLSAVIVVAFGFFNYLSLETNFIQTYFSYAHWNIKTNIFWGHLGELLAFILLITSNQISINLLKKNWKRIQKLTYLYFFSGAWFVFIKNNSVLALITIIVVFQLTLYTAIIKKTK